MITAISVILFFIVTGCLIHIGIRFYRMTNGRIRQIMYAKNFALAWSTGLYLLVTILSVIEAIPEIPVIVRAMSFIAMFPFTIIAIYEWYYIGVKRNPIEISETNK